MELTGQQRKQLHAALLRAFPTRAALARLVRFHLDQNLAVIGDGPDLGDLVFNLIEWADTHNRLTDLIAGAVAENPDNAALQTLLAPNAPPRPRTAEETIPHAPTGPRKRDKLQDARQRNFTGRQAELDVFQALLPLERALTVDLLMIWGIGGIGKSELLTQFQRLAQGEGLPTARLDPQSQTTIFDFLTSMHRQLKGQVTMPHFEAGVQRHQGIEAHLLARADLPQAVLHLFGKGEQASSAAGGASPSPPDVPVEAAISLIYSAVGHADGDFWMKPEGDLTERLMDDLCAYTTHARLVLLIDTYELMGAFDNWVRERLFAGLGEYGLLVLAGRRPLEGQGWQECSDLLRQIELAPLSAPEATAYLQKKGVSDLQVAQVMADYADGHPLTLALLVQVAGHVKATDLLHAPEHRQVIQQLLERITQNVAANLRAALESCAILRLVNEDSLAYMLDLPNVRAVFEEVRRFDFVKVRSDGIALHDTVWVAMNEELAWRSPAHYRALNAKAVAYYEQELAHPHTKDRDRLELERLYHRIRADEVAGIKLFQEMSEELVRYNLISRLSTLLSDMSDYPLQEESNRLWLDYYVARRAHLEDRVDNAEKVYAAIAENEQASAKLRAYALCDWGEILATRDHLLKDKNGSKVKNVLQRSLRLSPPHEYKMLAALWALGDVHRRLNALDLGMKYYQQAVYFIEQKGDTYTATLLKQKMIIILIHDRFYTINDYDELIRRQAALYQDHPNLRIDFIEAIASPCVWMGRYNATEQGLLEILTELETIQGFEYWYQDKKVAVLTKLCYVTGMSEKFAESHYYYIETLDAIERYQIERRNYYIGVVSGYYGATVVEQGKLEEALQVLSSTLQMKMHLDDISGLPEIFVWLGQLHEVAALETQDPTESTIATSKALSHYDECLRFPHQVRYYYRCNALNGVIRIKHRQGQYLEVEALLSEVLELAQQNEYNDQMAASQLIQGHLAWRGGHIPPANNFASAFRHYQLALIYGLRYNRFILDKVLGRSDPRSVLQPLVDFCLDQADEGSRMLTTLSHWWQTAIYDSSIGGPDTISNIPNGISLIEAEQIVRGREPGGGKLQLSVLAQLEQAVHQGR